MIYLPRGQAMYICVKREQEKVPGVLAVSASDLRPQFISHLLNLCSTASRLLSHHSAL